MSVRTIVLTISIALGSLQAWGEDAPKKQTIKLTAKWFKLTQLVDGEMRTIQGAGKLDARLKWRLLELYAEKMALVREKETKIFLGAPLDARTAKGKDHYFKDSRDWYAKSQKLGKEIIAEHPRFDDLAHVFYTLGINSRDYAKDKLAESNLHLALKAMRAGTSGADVLEHKIRTSLAEYYYNEKVYGRAIEFYGDVLKNQQDSWYTKHLFNSGWCHFKDRKYDAAIKQLVMAHEVGRDSVKANDGKYIPMSDQIMVSIGLFYSYAKRVHEGVEFYLNESDDPVRDLIKMSKITAEQNGADDTTHVIRSALKRAQKEGGDKGHQWEVDVRLAELELYRQFKMEEQYFLSAVALDDLNTRKQLPEEARDAIVSQVREVVGLMQEKLNRDAKKEEVRYNARELERIIAFFDVLYRVDKANAPLYRFYQGESQFSVGRFAQAAEFYRKGLDDSKARQVAPEKTEEEAKLRSRILNSMLATLGKSQYEKQASKEVREDYTTYAYVNYLGFWPKDETARQIYPKLFYIHLGGKRIDQAVSVVDAFHAAFPQDIEDQRGLLTAVMDFHIKSKNADALADWVTRLSNGHMQFSQDKIEKATEVLGNILFERYQKLEKDGDKKEAAQGYISLYEDKRYPKKVKGRAALNASILYLELGTVPESYEWQVRSFENFPKEEIKGQMKKVVALAQEYALLMDFRHSAELSEYALGKFCQDKLPQSDYFYKNVVGMRLLQEGAFEDNAKAAVKALDAFAKCGVDGKLKAELENKVLAHALKHNHLPVARALAARFEGNARAREDYAQTLPLLYWRARETGSSTLKDFSLKELLSNKHPQLEKIRGFEKLEISAEKFMAKSLPVDDVFDGDKFNQALEGRMLELKALNDQATVLLKSASPEVLLGTYRLLMQGYRSMGQELTAYAPQGVPPEFVKGFQNQMKQLSGNFEKQARTFFKQGRKAIQEHRLTTAYNVEFQESREKTDKKDKVSIGVRFPASAGALATMDSVKGIK